MCFLRSFAVLLVAAAFAAANPALSGNYGKAYGFGGYSGSSGLSGGYLGGSYGSGSNSYDSQKSRSLLSNSGYGSNGFDSVKGFGSRYGNSGMLGNNVAPGYSVLKGNGFSGASGLSGLSGNGFSGASGLSGLSGLSGNGFSGASGLSGLSGLSGKGLPGAPGFYGLSSFSGNGISGFGSSGVLFSFPSLTSTSYTRVPQQNDDLALLAIISAILADSENLNDCTLNNEAAFQAAYRQARTETAVSNASRKSNLAFVPVVAVPNSANQQKTTKIVKTTIETDGAVSSIPGLNGDLDDIASDSASGSDSFGSSSGSFGSGSGSFGSGSGSFGSGSGSFGSNSGSSASASKAYSAASSSGSSSRIY